MPDDVSAPLPQLDLDPGTVVTVTLDDPAAVVTSITLHGWQEVPAAPAPLPDILLTVAPGEAA